MASINSSAKGGIEYGSGSGDHEFVGGNVKMKGLTCSDVITGENGINITGKVVVGDYTGVSTTNTQYNGWIHLDGDNGYEGGTYNMKFFNGILVGIGHS